MREKSKFLSSLLVLLGLITAGLVIYGVYRIQTFRTAPHLTGKVLSCHQVTRHVKHGTQIDTYCQIEVTDPNGEQSSHNIDTGKWYQAGQTVSVRKVGKSYETRFGASGWDVIPFVVAGIAFTWFIIVFAFWFRGKSRTAATGISGVSSRRRNSRSSSATGVKVTVNGHEVTEAQTQQILAEFQARTGIDVHQRQFGQQKSAQMVVIDNLDLPLGADQDAIRAALGDNISNLLTWSLEHGQPAIAQVRSVATTSTGTGVTSAEMQVLVYPESGSAPFPSQLVLHFAPGSARHAVWTQVGAQIPVRYNPRKPGEVQLDIGRIANPAAPAGSTAPAAPMAPTAPTTPAPATPATSVAPVFGPASQPNTDSTSPPAAPFGAQAPGYSPPAPNPAPPVPAPAGPAELPPGLPPPVFPLPTGPEDIPFADPTAPTPLPPATPLDREYPSY